MRAILHHPRFQTLEAIWRSTAWLVSRLEIGEQLTLSLLDVTREELARDLDAAGADLTRSGLHQRLVERGPARLGGEPWSLLVGHFSFGPDADSAWLLARLGAVAARAGGPFLASADPAHLGVASLAAGADPAAWSDPGGADTELWQELRTSGVAPWIGLALPRLLLRLPYGTRTDPIDAFAFEEATPGAAPPALLWGSAAVACAWLLARAFEERGWLMQPGDVLDLDDLPAWTQPGGDPRRLACAEAQLSDAAAEALAQRGFLALQGHARRNGVRLLRFQSVASPPAPLAGPWA
jgi:type VI secretion system protein ImpC